uniref:zinc finger FYVE domain-containing protein 9-like n=1 Tax=Myxine glutinosa TaxID=7769 RepID=UPI00358F64A4
MMDQLFLAAVSDLDKVLDDFEQHEDDVQHIDSLRTASRQHSCDGVAMPAVSGSWLPSTDWSSVRDASLPDGNVATAVFCVQPVCDVSPSPQSFATAPHRSAPSPPPTLASPDLLQPSTNGVSGICALPLHQPALDLLPDCSVLASRAVPIDPATNDIMLSTAPCGLLTGTPEPGNREDGDGVGEVHEDGIWVVNTAQEILEDNPALRTNVEEAPRPDIWPGGQQGIQQNGSLLSCRSSDAKEVVGEAEGEIVADFEMVVQTPESESELSSAVPERKSRADVGPADEHETFPSDFQERLIESESITDSVNVPTVVEMQPAVEGSLEMENSDGESQEFDEGIGLCMEEMEAFHSEEPPEINNNLELSESIEQSLIETPNSHSTVNVEKGDVDFVTLHMAESSVPSTDERLHCDPTKTLCTTFTSEQLTNVPIEPSAEKGEESVAMHLPTDNQKLSTSHMKIGQSITESPPKKSTSSEVVAYSLEPRSLTDACQVHSPLAEPVLDELNLVSDEELDKFLREQDLEDEEVHDSVKQFNDIVEDGTEDCGIDKGPRRVGSLKEDLVLEEKELEDSKSDTSADSLSPLKVCPMINPVCNLEGEAVFDILTPLSPEGGARPKCLQNLAHSPVSTEDWAAAGLGVEDNRKETNLVTEFSTLDVASELEECTSRGAHPGSSAPTWVPDGKARSCMRCEIRFTFTRRRHHCRACGKVFCATCCSRRASLAYMDSREARVCLDCYTDIIRAKSTEQAPVSGTTVPPACFPSPNPSNPAEYCSTVPPLQQAQADGTLASPPPTVMVPVSVLKHPGTDGSQARESRRVWFADGLLPNGEVADTTRLFSHPPLPPRQPHDPGDNSVGEETRGTPDGRGTEPSSVGHPALTILTGSHPAVVGSPVGKGINLIPEDEDGLPPILISTGVKGDYTVEERPNPHGLVRVLEEEGAEPMVFVLNANLLVSLTIINYANRRCWAFCTRGLNAVGQPELLLLLQVLSGERVLPKDVFVHFLHVYQDAVKGKSISNLKHSFLGGGLLNSREHAGFLYVERTCQPLPDMALPAPPFLFAILVQKWEAPWAKLFPLRLMLRLGAEFRFYPCPLFSVRFRKPLFGETGHTIMNLLADFRNYQYSLPTVPGLTISMEVGKNSIEIPSNRYNEMLKVLNSCNEHVLAFGAALNHAADSHLVCVQSEDDGTYHTQAISIHSQPRKVTGASFVVFNGALKPSSGFLAKSSIVEDGLMVQLNADEMERVRTALRDMKDITVICGKTTGEGPRDEVCIHWGDDDRRFNVGIKSPIDSMAMEGVPSIKVVQGSEVKGNGKVMKWTELFFLQGDSVDPAEHTRLAESVARAFSRTLAPHLKLLWEDGLTRLALRLTLASDQVGYLAGASGQPLPQAYLGELDSALVPVIHGATPGPAESPLACELLFHILHLII